jgi:FAD binding domain
MHNLAPAQQSALEAIVGARCSFDETERSLYGHDIAAIPPLIAALIGNTLPSGVVQPETEEEVIALARWAADHRIPLTPRGKATSGYGGVIPVRRGVVVDVSRMKRIKSIDETSLTATVEPAVVWEKLGAALAKHDLPLRLYPTSYPSSSAGGWLAQGGAGIGSYEAGWFRDNVVRARVVLATGDLREWAGDDLALVSDAEGITGVLTELTVKVQRSAASVQARDGSRRLHEPRESAGQRPSRRGRARRRRGRTRRPRAGQRRADTRGRAAGGGPRSRHTSRRRLVCVRLLAVRLLRGRMRSVLRSRLGEPVAPREVVLAAWVHRGQTGLEPGDGRQLSRLHDL